MSYFQTGYRLVEDIVRGEFDESGPPTIDYGEACGFARDTFHGLAMAALGGAGVAFVLGRPLVGATLGLFSALGEHGAKINQENIERFELAQARRASTNSAEAEL